ncbi:hypothetical protein C7460_11035 [Marinoscillum furvescens DSM 4134]|uniref:Uncharacterized protein n=1 Tax=Marinoscillum furvescens DSM 4134 TaxID=1122208 RepID=A0A3D9L1W4_MARFU|nr:hypothetical protein C7460_11035 [Marinoscillum furvescens DSM 4134]
MILILHLTEVGVNKCNQTYQNSGLDEIVVHVGTGCRSN